MILDENTSVQELGKSEVNWSNPGVAYSYLLGVYLGDGHIRKGQRGSVSIRIACDPKYPKIMAEICMALRVLFPERPILTYKHKTANCQYLCLHSPRLLELFPQHGPGRKHTRPIVLEDWQKTGMKPKALLRGLIHTDGYYDSRATYPYYGFTNSSRDIHTIFQDALNELDIHWTYCEPAVSPKSWTKQPFGRTTISRQKDVNQIYQFVGKKE